MRNASVPGSANVLCSCDCCGSQPQGMDISELAFVQIVIVIVVMTVMVVVIVCLLNHYRLSAWALISRLNRSRDHSMPEGCSWPTDSLVTQPGSSEVMYGPRGQDRCNPPSFQQRENPWRFQPTYPYLPQGIDLPPSISLSDGEELPPYKGPCTLQLRDPEQQQELSRASVRAPPNRTVFDSDLVDVYVHGGGGPRPPSSNSGKSASSNRPEGPPPTYSEVMAQSGANPAPFLHQHSNNAPPPAQQPGTQSGTRKLAAV
ncbi:low-density lipoprotein receptor class A domain-containing protein 4 isoform X2 [Denticeps clupeoides]|uniref:low-density lipoprotein receptor class A domain-containing protein 4 isoform X2 n=1 Tax=Denticeps clupeoides TaxID=299321 RepID=UPI0010A2C4B6|nr:low-density lipoprotein receptor class A domain-containing protein 4-like isoform X2 [Denticeps clupeoides]XP_028820624.1 low-density lipoprotein receptor class A domain-containing protein 4-like isoform X2 [Denticeps clupeoides]